MDQLQTRSIIKRKKLWEIDECYKCSVIGSCLTRGEMRRLNQEKILSLSQDADDYQLHSHFIEISRQKDSRSKVLHRFLEKKHRRATSKYFRVETQAEIERLWQQDMAAGLLASAWWAIATHPRATTDLLNRIYGQLHMLSHDCIGTYHNKQSMLTDLKAKVQILEEVLATDRQAYLQERRKLQKEISALRMEVKAKANILQNTPSPPDATFMQKRPISESAPVGALNHDCRRGKKEAELTAELEQLRRQRAEAAETITELQGRQQELLQQQQEQKKEIASLETLLLQHIDRKDPCETCSKQHTGNCPGLDLCGKTVLYVGGLNRMVPHYRQLIERYGGRFFHHDGGKEASRNLLPKMLVAADAVFCPVDRVSHDACNCVKKLCKRYQKPVVFMRSASLSALVKGLDDIQ